MLDDGAEIMALHRLLFELQFDVASDGFDLYRGSPQLASLRHQVLDALIAADEQQGRAPVAERWRRWRDAAAHPTALDAVRALLAREVLPEELGASERIEHVRTLLAPLEAGDDLLHELAALTRR